MQISFNKKAENMINRFLAQYEGQEEFRKSVEEKYDKSPYELSIIEIYALEEFEHYGNYDIYESYLALKDKDMSIEEHLEFYENFREKITTNLEFAMDKYTNIKNLTKQEMFIMYMILSSIARNEGIKLYDPLNVKSVDSELEYFKTVRNHIINIQATAIYYKSPKLFDRRKTGQFSKESKELIINIIRKNPYLRFKIELFIFFLMYSPIGLVYSMNGWDKYNTNISYDDVYGDPKNPTLTK